MGEGLAYMGYAGLDLPAYLRHPASYGAYDPTSRRRPPSQVQVSSQYLSGAADKTLLTLLTLLTLPPSPPLLPADPAVPRRWENRYLLLRHPITSAQIRLPLPYGVSVPPTPPPPP